MTRLRVNRTGLPARYEILSGSDSVTTVSARTTQHGGELDIGGHTYQLDNSALGRKCILRADDGQEVASAERGGLRSWRIATGERELRLTRIGLGSRNLELTEAGGRIGWVRRSARGAEAELPELARPIEVFVLVVALAMWQRRRKAIVIGR
ncbi:hypothetical protein [Mycobacteroides abscessus]|uniref:hypothetical protein n=1 Tax=Mycobacteroides abscessus TaxID=36809 RepID=UPI0019D0B5CF|nr:hypothetical protein [Mycobacteroides abscessus]MBN7560190.1 hypothetical protein [Mycobacteroides abscessus subsp. abscessus]